MRVSFHPRARDEVGEAQAWYEERSLLAAAGFLHEISLAVRRIGEEPHRYPVALHDTRRVLLNAALPIVLLAVGACNTNDRNDDAFWASLQQLCNKAYEGRVVEGTEPSDQAMKDSRLVMHVRSCSPTEVRVPFHVGDNRSRTWVISRTDTGLRLKHDHRHEDGQPDKVTDYGGDGTAAANALTVDFPADTHTATLLPAAATNIWTLTIDPGRTFVYALRREGSGRRFRAEFDLSRAVETPPAPW